MFVWNCLHLNVGNLKQKQKHISLAKTSLICRFSYWAHWLQDCDFWLPEPVGITELPNTKDGSMAGVPALLVPCPLRTGLARSKPVRFALFHSGSQQPDILYVPATDHRAGSGLRVWMNELVWIHSHNWQSQLKRVVHGQWWSSSHLVNIMRVVIIILPGHRLVLVVGVLCHPAGLQPMISGKIYIPS